MANDGTAGSAKRGFRINATAWMTIMLSSMYFIMYLDRVNISIMAKDIMRDFSLSKLQLGIAFSAFSWPYLFGQLAGRLACQQNSPAPPWPYAAY